MWLVKFYQNVLIKQMHANSMETVFKNSSLDVQHCVKSFIMQHRKYQNNL